MPQVADDAQDKEALYELWRQLLSPVLPISSLKAATAASVPYPRLAAQAESSEPRKCELTVGSD